MLCLQVHLRVILYRLERVVALVSLSFFLSLCQYQRNRSAHDRLVRPGANVVDRSRKHPERSPGPELCMHWLRYRLLYNVGPGSLWSTTLQHAVHSRLNTDREVGRYNPDFVPWTLSSATPSFLELTQRLASLAEFPQEWYNSLIRGQMLGPCSPHYSRIGLELYIARNSAKIWIGYCETQNIGAIVFEDLWCIFPVLSLPSPTCLCLGYHVGNWPLVALLHVVFDGGNMLKILFSITYPKSCIHWHF